MFYCLLLPLLNSEKQAEYAITVGHMSEHTDIEPFFPPVVSSEYEERPQVLALDGGRLQQIRTNDTMLVAAMRSETKMLFRSPFTANGCKLYDDNGPEWGLPECNNPVELLDYSIAQDSVTLNALARYILEVRPQMPEMRGARAIIGSLRRRVIDGAGQTWACHDNVSISGALAGVLPAHNQSVPVNPRNQLLLKHLMMRGFISGAGLVTDKGFKFSQKLDSIIAPTNHQRKSAHFRVDVEHGGRLEGRSSDRNVNNAAAVLRVGGLAFVASIMSTPLVHELSRSDGTDIEKITEGRQFNPVTVNKDGTIMPTPELVRALTYERRLAEASRDELGHYVKIPEVYQQIAKMWVRYIDTFELVMQGHASIDDLAPWSDWARKFGLVLDYVAKDPGERSIGDVKAMKIDQQYDATELIIAGDSVRIRHGIGVQDQHDPKLDFTPSSQAVAMALRRPPDTRAVERTHGFATASIPTKWNWHMMEYVTCQGETKQLQMTFRPTYDF